jgi:hypothetical protein
VVRPRVVAVVARHRFRFDNQNFAICRILSTHCTNRDRKKGIKREAFGRLTTKSF